MLDPRISVHMYPLDLWGMFISKLCKEGKHKKALSMIDSLSQLCITDIFPKLYNQVLEKHIIFKHRS
jgi:pentatricopeptide repeat protein